MKFDLIVIGGGPGGHQAALEAAKHGLSVALVEKVRLGGTCLNVGCVPTKAYLHMAQAGERDWQAMLARKNEIVGTLRAGMAASLSRAKVTLFEGEATLTGVQSPYTVRVSGQEEGEHSAAHVILATGSRPAILPVKGCGDPALYTSDTLLSDEGTTPFDSLIIVGGGVIGVEMAFLYCKLGVKVSILEAESGLLPMLDRELGRSAEALLKGMGCELMLGARLGEIVRRGDGYAAMYQKGDATGELCAQRVLLSTGRWPNAEGLPTELERAGRFINVDSDFQTNLQGVYAIGDVNGQMQLAHAASAQAMCAVARILGQPRPIDPGLIPACVYLAPEIASVGMTQDECKAQGREVMVSKALVTQNARTLIENLGRGFIKLIFDKQTRALIGAQLFCGRASDLIAELTLAIESQLTADDLAKTVHPHPSFAEAIAEAARGV